MSDQKSNRRTRPSYEIVTLLFHTDFTYFSLNFLLIIFPRYIRYLSNYREVQAYISHRSIPRKEKNRIGGGLSFGLGSRGNSDYFNEVFISGIALWSRVDRAILRVASRLENACSPLAGAESGKNYRRRREVALSPAEIAGGGLSSLN